MLRTPVALVLALVVLSVLGLVQGAVPDGEASASDEPRVIPAEVVERILEGARLQAKGGPLPTGFRILEELTLTEDPKSRRPGPLVLTPRVMSRLVRAGMGPVLAGGLGQRGSSTFVTIPAVKDNTLYENPGGFISNGAGPYVFVGKTGSFAGETIRRAVLAFDVDAVIPPTATILSATLTMDLYQGMGGAQSLSLYRLTSDWGEGTSDAGTPGGAGTGSTTGDATWIHTSYNTAFWTTVGGDFVGTPSATTVVDSPNFYSWSSAQLAADVTDMHLNPGTDFGWVLRGNEVTPNTAKRFGARENTVPASRPELTVEYSGMDTVPPTITWGAPSAGASLTREVETTLSWTASDPSGIAFFDLMASFDGGVTYLPVALGLPGTATTFDWFPPNRPGGTILRLEATDGAMNTGSADRAISVLGVLDSRVPTTLRDFDQPGTQPLEGGLDIRSPQSCGSCHGGFDPNTEPYYGWLGSMMANAGRDPLFHACLAIAEQDAAGSGDLCIRCHAGKGWLEGRSTPTDGSQLQVTDRSGVSCDACHRAVDPIYVPGESPPEDLSVLAALSNPPTVFANGMIVIDPDGTRRGPFEDAVCDEVAHPFLASPFHRESALCGTCHNVSNPAFEADGNGNFLPTFDQPASDFGHGSLMPIERTFSEWENSDYNTPQGVYAPELGGNRDFVRSCQDCHMRAATGTGCDPARFPTAPVRDDLPLHDLTGGNTWIPTLLAALYPGEVDPFAQAAAVQRARFMLQNSADLEARLTPARKLEVTVTNNTGHKLPTGYPEGRRVWLNVRFYDVRGRLVGESGGYDFDTGELEHDSELKLYEAELGLDAAAAGLAGLPVGPSFHFVLNNKVFKDNRIPPRGFTNAAYASFGGQPVGATYADGQYWDETLYDVPRGAVKAVVTLYYQTTSKEYVEFLRDENTTDGSGQLMYDLWDQNGKCPPEIMEQTTLRLYEVTPLADPLGGRR